MANEVYANNMEVSCKAASGKSICAFPDVCFTPPQTPATPPGVPIPYPNTGMASDTSGGSKSVKISNQEVMLKDKSCFKQSTGDEAGSAPKKGVVTSKIKGKVYFTSWSMNVKAEGENVVRNLDLTTHNHGSQGPNTPPTVYADGVAPPGTEGEEETPKCECCGKDAHSAMQASGDEISEQEFYSPAPPAGEQVPQFAVEAQTLLANIRNSPCKHLLPPEKPKPATKCNKYYLTTSREKRRIEGQWDDYRDKYYKKFKVPKSQAVGHRVPKTAGGCPTGPGNLMPVPEGCEETEAALSNLQGRAIRWHRRVRGM